MLCNLQVALIDLYVKPREFVQLTGLHICAQLCFLTDLSAFCAEFYPKRMSDDLNWDDDDFEVPREKRQLHC